MSFYQDRVLPRLIDVALGGPDFRRIRARVAGGLSGEVLEVGFGSGLNVPHYPDDVKQVQAVDPATAGRKLAEKRLEASSVPIDFVGLDGQDLAIEADSVDHVLVTWSLCTIPEPGRALKEMHRVLRPGGQLHFVEHGLAPEPATARWQDRLTPLQKRLAGGCHLNRPIGDLISQAGFELLALDNYYLRGPKPFGYMYEGVGVKK